MATITERIYLGSTFLDKFDPDDQLRVEQSIEDAFTYYQDILGKSESEYLDEANYTPKEKSLIVAFCNLDLAKGWVSRESSKKWDATNTPTFLKKKKVDVLEKEFAVNTMAEKQSVSATVNLENLQKEVCKWEDACKITNGLCQENNANSVVVVTTYFPNC